MIIDRREDGNLMTEATVKVHAGGRRVITTAEGNGPVNALDLALRSALEEAFPRLADLELSDYKVRILPGKHGTDATTRVLIETSNKAEEWTTVGVHPNIIEASWLALADAVRFGLLERWQLLALVARPLSLRLVLHGAVLSHSARCICQTPPVVSDAWTT